MLYHKYADLIPEMTEEEFAGLKKDIEANGLIDDIVLLNAKILDGRHRYEACQELGIEPRFVDFEDLGAEETPLNYILSKNLTRRHLTSSQKAAIAVEAEDIMEELEPEKGQGTRTDLEENKLPQEIAEVNDPEERETRTKLAKNFDTNRQYISDAKKIKEEDPEGHKKIKKGEETITSYKKKKKKEAREEAIEKQKREVKNAQNPDGRFDIIVVDPPWEYGRSYDPDGSRVASPYPEMHKKEIENIQLPAKEDCILWLWTTQKFIWDAKEILNEWGFEYKAILVWNKEKIGMGSWLRMQTEFCLLGIKGNPVWGVTDMRDYISEARREHSRKPERFYELIENKLVGRKLDYFARERREGWETYGTMELETGS